MKSKIGFNAILVAFCLGWIAYDLKVGNYWYLLVWVPLLALNTWALEKDVHTYKEKQRMEARLRALNGPTPLEQRIADTYLSKGVEPVETPEDVSWRERHVKDCSICKEFYGESK